MNIQHSALLLIEFQNEWLSTDGKLHHHFVDKKQYLTSLINAEKSLMNARESQLSIIHSGLCYTTQYTELGHAKQGLRRVIRENKTFMAGTDSVEFSTQFRPKENEFIVQGRIGSSAFSGSNLDAYLRNNNITTLYIMGYALHVCIESTLRAAHDLGYEVIIIDDASSAFTEEQKKYFFNNIVHHFGSSVSTENFIIDLQFERNLK